MEDQILKTIEEFDGKITAADLALKSGFTIYKAHSELIKLSYQVNGHLQTIAKSLRESNIKVIVYVFPHNIRQILDQKITELNRKEQRRKIFESLFYFIRLFIGAILIFSLCLVYGIIFIITIKQRDGHGDVSTFLSRLTFYYLIRNRHFPHQLIPQYQPPIIPQEDLEEQQSNGINLSFIESIFSFLFGDGNPNVDFEKNRWEVVGSLIGRNKGVVIADQICSSVIDLVPPNEDYASEKYMLPVLKHFNGRPFSTNEGIMVYCFPDLTSIDHFDMTIEPELPYEEYWKFSEASQMQIYIALILGIFNFLGLAILRGFIYTEDSNTLLTANSTLLLIVRIIWKILQVYAICYLCIPAIRYLWLSYIKNPSIERRNAMRVSQQQLFEKQLSDSTESEVLQQKLNAALRFVAMGNLQDLVSNEHGDMELSNNTSMRSILPTSSNGANQELKQD